MHIPRRTGSVSSVSSVSLLITIFLTFTHPVLAGVDCYTHGVTVSLLPLTPWLLIYSYTLIVSTLRLKYIHVKFYYSVSKCYKNKKHLNDV